MSSYPTLGYKSVDNFIDGKTTKIISQYLENKILRGDWDSVKEKTVLQPSVFERYADPLAEVMLIQYQNAVEQHTGLLLYPTYSYCRVYQGGDKLVSHLDRLACEVSVSINIACTKDSWPFWIKYKNKASEQINLKPGDAVIYKGCEARHWRDELPKGSINVQLMLHYVSQNGPNSRHKFDKRDVIGSPPRQKN
jgi:alkylated DNA repair dioxygenase AlkB